ncbi:MAG TPA: LamB/YcsF family protein [Elusimicrobiales bacterium]|nr:LamB/YcsF family protein [Elusimicrobiales bacterium]
MMRINCDIGERGPGNAGDIKLMEVIHIANLACGGHAGDARTIEVFRALAQKHGVELAAHLSYPDRANFGRTAMKLSGTALLAALDAQLELLPGVHRVKFHGALYNEACRDPELAAVLAAWLQQAGVREILAPDDAELTRCARARGIAVLREAFAERRYKYDRTGRRLSLVSRSQPDASLSVLAEAAAQAEEIILRQRVNIQQRGKDRPIWKTLAADTICIHSDSAIALELARALRRLIEPFRLARPGLCETAGLPIYGSQDLAVTPGGAMDQFSLRRGNLLLGNPPGAAALEMVSPPEIEILAPGSFAVTGARRPVSVLSGGKTRAVVHGSAQRVAAGDLVTFGEKEDGLRAYFCFRPGAGSAAGQAGKTVSGSAVNAWADARGRIRVLRGPEYNCLAEPELFFEEPWQTTRLMDRMGMRLDGKHRLGCGQVNMVSGPVADGTVQLSPAGPIILLRHRATTGGYPRIFNVISADIDLLAQYGPGREISFVEVNRAEARKAARQKESVLKSCMNDSRGGSNV